MIKAQSLVEIIDAIKRSSDSGLRIVSKTLPMAIAKGDSDLIHRNIRSGALDCLRAAMVYARHDKNYPVARQYCCKGADYADALTDSKHRHSSDLPWSGFYVLYCCLIAGRFDRAEQVAQWMLQCPVNPFDNTDPHDPLAMLSGYAVLDMSEEFAVYRHRRFDTSWHREHPFFGPLSVYLDVWQAILKRDQATFNESMLRREEHHISLSKQRSEGRIEFGGGKDSRFIVDFMGIGCAIMARKRELIYDADTTYLPRAMLDVAFV